MKRNKELEIANDILSFLQNIKVREDVETFTRIYLEAVLNSGIDIDTSKVIENIADVDKRFEHVEDRLLRYYTLKEWEY